MQQGKSVACAICSKTYNIDCVQLSVSEVRKIYLRSGLAWSYTNCLKIGADLNSLRAVIVTLQEEIASLKSELVVSKSYEPSLVQTEKVIQEVLDRSRRASNIIIYGCDETGNISASVQGERDNGTVRKVLVGLGSQGDFVSVQRLGRFDPTRGRPRPLKVHLSTESATRSVLRNSVKLKNNADLAGISISRDRTPFEINLYKSIKQELTQRQAEGEPNLRIKYKNGIPTIVSEN